jgi:hypothetical protein
MQQTIIDVLLAKAVCGNIGAASGDDVIASISRFLCINV